MKRKRMWHRQLDFHLIAILKKEGVGLGEGKPCFFQKHGFPSPIKLNCLPLKA